MGDELTVGFMALLAGAGLALFIITFWFEPLAKLRGWFAAGVLAGGMFLLARWTTLTPPEAIEGPDAGAGASLPTETPQHSTSEAELQDRRAREDDTFNPEKPADAGDGVGGRNWLDL